MTSAPRRSSSGANRSGGVPSRLLPSSLGRHLRDDRQVAHAAHGRDRRADLVEVAERLEDEQVDAAVDQRRRLFAEVGLGLVHAESCPTARSGCRAGPMAPATYACSRAAWRAIRAPCDVDLVELVGEAEGAELDPVRAEGVRLEHVRAGPHVLAVHLGHDVRLSEVQRVEAPVEEDALRVQHRPHRAVAYQHAGLDRLEKGLHYRRAATRPVSSTPARAGPTCPR